MVEGAALEKQCAGNRTVGSNPTLSAIVRRSALAELWTIVGKNENPSILVCQNGFGESTSSTEACFEHEGA